MIDCSFSRGGRPVVLVGKADFKTGYLAVLLISITISATAAAAAPEPDAVMKDYVKQLTDAKGKSWVLTDFLVFRRPGGCFSGEQYIFRSNGSVQIDRCADGQRLISSGRWRMERRGPIDIYLTIDKTAYELSFKTADKRQMMRLRSPSSSKTSVTTDLVFKLKSE